MNTRLLFNASAIVEVLTGLALLVAPLFVIGLLLGDELSPTGAAVSRVLGIGLFSLGISAWETARPKTSLAPRAGICIYNVSVALLLSILGVPGGMNGPLLWPAAVVHALMGAAMLRVILVPSPESTDA
jgi:hypothetical protein